MMKHMCRRKQLARIFPLSICISTWGNHAYSQQFVPLGNHINPLNAISGDSSYSIESGLQCPTATLNFGGYAGDGNQWGNSIQPVLSTNAGSTNYGIAAGIRIPLGGSMAAFCKRYAEAKAKFAELSLDTYQRNNAINFTVQCQWITRIYPHIENLPSGDRYKGFLDCPAYAASNKDRTQGDIFVRPPRDAGQGKDGIQHNNTTTHRQGPDTPEPLTPNDQTMQSLPISPTEQLSPQVPVLQINRSR
jgi:hypothetical protein